MPMELSTAQKLTLSKDLQLLITTLSALWLTVTPNMSKLTADHDDIF